MQNVEVDKPPAIFLVVMREVLIARDIEMIIRDLRIEAQVVLACTLDEATAAVPAGRIEAAFVQMDVGDFVSTELSRRVATDGGRTVLVGLEATRATVLADAPAEVLGLAHVDEDAGGVPEAVHARHRWERVPGFRPQFSIK